MISAGSKPRVSALLRGGCDYKEEPLDLSAATKLFPPCYGAVAITRAVNEQECAQILAEFPPCYGAVAITRP